jgi:putative DNA primase/helicase
LEQVFDGSQSVIDYVQRFCGYALTGDVREQVLDVYYGKGANGKTTFLNAYMAAVGDGYTMKAAPDFLMARKYENHPCDRADLFGKRFVAAVETGSGQWLNESLVKELSGGDKVRARRMRENFWQFDPTHKLVICTNHKPRVKGTDHAIWRRLRLVPFTVTFADNQQDKTLPEKLRHEAEGILAWVVRGCIEWQSRGLDAPDAVLAATSDYRSEQDTVGTFIAEACDIGSDYQVAFKTLYAGLEAWCQDSGDDVPSKKLVGLYLQEQGYEQAKMRGRGYRGLRLQDTTTTLV